MIIESNPVAVLAWQRHRSQNAANWLFHTHRHLAVRAASRSGVPSEMHDDAVQEVFAQVFEALPGYTEREPLECWIAVIARNTCSKIRRRWTHRRRFSACFENAALDVADCDLQDHENRPDSALMRQEFYRNVQVVLNGLSRRERELIENEWDENPSGKRASSAERTALCRARAATRRRFADRHF